jgi:endonuclease-3
MFDYIAHYTASNEGPANWRVVYNNILEMRKERSAPVDSMGCERAQDLQAEPKV